MFSSAGFCAETLAVGVPPLAVSAPSPPTRGMAATKGAAATRGAAVGAPSPAIGAPPGPT